MEKKIKMQDFWMYVAQIQEEVSQEVLEQVEIEEYFPCMRVITDYMFNLRATHLDRIWAMNRSGNKFIKLINEALKKRGIFISEYSILISSTEL